MPMQRGKKKKGDEEEVGGGGKGRQKDGATTGHCLALVWAHSSLTPSPSGGGNEPSPEKSGSQMLHATDEFGGNSRFLGLPHSHIAEQGPDWFWDHPVRVYTWPWDAQMTFGIAWHVWGHWHGIEPTGSLLQVVFAHSSVLFLVPLEREKCKQKQPATLAWDGNSPPIPLSHQRAKKRRLVSCNSWCKVSISLGQIVTQRKAKKKKKSSFAHTLPSQRTHTTYNTDISHCPAP